MSQNKHSHQHSHTATDKWRIAAALSVTGIILIAELIGSAVTGSLALAADAGHMAVDSVGLVIALIAAHLIELPPTARYTWGWVRSEVLAAALQAGMLLIISTILTYESITRLISPTDITSAPMLVIGIIGLVANIVSLRILSGGQNSSLNMRAAFLEVANDALGSVAVIVSAIVIWMTGWNRADAIVSLLIVILMVPRAAKLLREATEILLEATPKEIDLDRMIAHLQEIEGVNDVHDLHISTLKTGNYSLTAHVGSNVTTMAEQEQLLHRLEACARKCGPLTISHTTFQLEPATHQNHEEINH